MKYSLKDDTIKMTPQQGAVETINILQGTR